MNQGGRLECLPGLLPSHIAMSQAMEFLINEWHELLKSALVARAPGSEQACHFVLRCRGSCLLTPIHTRHALDGVQDYHSEMRQRLQFLPAFPAFINKTRVRRFRSFP